MDTIKKCFRSGGVLNSNSDVSSIGQEEGPFQDIDANLEMCTLLCVDSHDDNKEENFFESLKDADAVEEVESDDEDFITTSTQNKVTKKP